MQSDNLVRVPLTTKSPSAGAVMGHRVDDRQRQYGWERGEIDYLGVDSFDNILSRLKDSLKKPIGGSLDHAVTGRPRETRRASDEGLAREKPRKNVDRRVGKADEGALLAVAGSGSGGAVDRAERGLSVEIQRRKVLVNSSTGEPEDKMAAARKRLMEKELKRPVSGSSFRSSAAGDAEFGAAVSAVDAPEVKIDGDRQLSPESGVEIDLDAGVSSTAADSLAIPDAADKANDLSKESNNVAIDEARKVDSFTAGVEEDSQGGIVQEVQEKKGVEEDSRLAENNVVPDTVSAGIEVSSRESSDVPTRVFPEQADIEKKGVLELIVSAEEVESHLLGVEEKKGHQIALDQSRAAEDVIPVSQKDIFDSQTSSEKVQVESQSAGVERKSPADGIVVEQHGAGAGEGACIRASAVVVAEVEPTDVGEKSSGTDTAVPSSVVLVEKPAVGGEKVASAAPSQKKKNKKRRNK